MDPLKILERKIMAWGTFATVVLIVIDALLFMHMRTTKARVEEIHPERFWQSHTHLDSLAVVHDLKVESKLDEIEAQLREMQHGR